MLKITMGELAEVVKLIWLGGKYEDRFDECFHVHDLIFRLERYKDEVIEFQED